MSTAITEKIKLVEDKSQFLSGEILSRLSRFGKIHLFDTVTSTQEIARRIAKSKNLDYIQNDGPAIQAIVIANQQTLGHGRFGRHWYSPEHGLYFSVLIGYPLGHESQRLNDKSITLWTLLSAKIVAEVLEETSSIPIYIKWPNDLVCDRTNTNRYRKIGGILCETKYTNSLFHSGPKYLIIGIGLNINQTSFPPEIPDATSLKQELTIIKNIKQDVNCEEILYKIIDKLSLTLACYQNSLITKTIDDFRKDLLMDIKKRSIIIGKKVKVMRRLHAVSGTVLDIDEYGRLVLRTDSSRIAVFDSGRVVKITGL